MRRTEGGQIEERYYRGRTDRGQEDGVGQGRTEAGRKENQGRTDGGLRTEGE